MGEERKDSEQSTWNEWIIKNPHAEHEIDKIRIVNTDEAMSFTDNCIEQLSYKHLNVWKVLYPRYYQNEDEDPSLTQFNKDFHSQKDYAKSLANIIINDIVPTDYFLYYVPHKDFFGFVGRGHNLCALRNKDNELILTNLLSDLLCTWVDYNMEQCPLIFGANIQLDRRWQELRSFVRDDKNIKKIFNWIKGHHKVAFYNWDDMNSIEDFAVATVGGALNMAGPDITTFHAQATHRFTHIYSTAYVPDAAIDENVDKVIDGNSDKNANKRKQLLEKLGQLCVRIKKVDKQSLVLVNGGNTGKNLFMDFVSITVGAGVFSDLDRGHVCGAMSTASKGESPQEIFADTCRNKAGVYIDEINSDSKDKKLTQEKLKIIVNEGMKTVTGKNGSPERLTPVYGIIMLANLPLELGSIFCGTAQQRLLLLYSRYEAKSRKTKPHHMLKIPNLRDKLKSKQSRQYMMKLLMDNAHSVMNRHNRHPYVAPEVQEYTDKYFAESSESTTPSKIDTHTDEKTTPITNFIAKTKKRIDVGDDAMTSIKTKILFDNITDDCYYNDLKQIEAEAQQQIFKAKERRNKRMRDGSKRKSFYQRARSNKQNGLNLKSGNASGTVLIPTSIVKEWDSREAKKPRLEVGFKTIQPRRRLSSQRNRLQSTIQPSQRNRLESTIQSSAPTDIMKWNMWQNELKNKAMEIYYKFKMRFGGQFETTFDTYSHGKRLEIEIYWGFLLECVKTDKTWIEHIVRCYEQEISK
eukprot:59565_1